jgi:cytochrome b6-f complex iron-sulfur subunit
MAEPARSRRSTVRTLIVSALGAAGLWRFLTPRSGAGSSKAAVSVPEADVPVGGALVLPEHRLALVREGDRFLALDLTCTHLGCTVTATAEGFACPCHGSRFSTAGDVLRGPAPRALRRLQLDRRDGLLRVSRADGFGPGLERGGASG